MSFKGAVFNGPKPAIIIAPDQAAECQQVANWLRARTAEGLEPQEIAVIVRSQDQIGRAKRAAELSGLNSRILDQEADTTSGRISVCTMHLAKGLEFRAVTVIACDDEIIPLQARIDAVTDDADLEAGRGRRGHQVNFEQARVGLRCPLSSSIEVYCTERHLLYVACTRARDHLLLTATKPASEFLGDLGQ